MSRAEYYPHLPSSGTRMEHSLKDTALKFNLFGYLVICTSPQGAEVDAGGDPVHPALEKSQGNLFLVRSMGSNAFQRSMARGRLQSLAQV